MSLKDKITELVNQEYRNLKEREDAVLRVLTDVDDITSINSFFGDISGVLDKYQIPGNTPAITYADQVFFARKSLDVAKELMGAKIYSGSNSGLITETGAYEGHAIRKLKGLEFAPGDVYTMMSQGGKTNLVINSDNQGVASVVTIRGLELDDGSKLGPSEIAPYLNISKNDDGKLFSDIGLKIELNQISSTFVAQQNAQSNGLKMSNNCLGYYKN